MPRKIDTGWYYYFFGTSSTKTKSESSYYTDGYWCKIVRETNVDELKGALEKFSEYCNENQYEIKSMFPLTRSTCYEHAVTGGAIFSRDSDSNVCESPAWGIGFGWGVTDIVGFAAMLQRWIES